MRRPRLAAYGHSWVAGEAATTPARCFVALVAAELGASLDNRAVGGSATSDLARLVDRDECPPADLFVVMSGLNDARLHGDQTLARKDYERHLNHLLTAFRAAAPTAQVVCVEQPPLLDYSGYPPHDHGSTSVVSDYNDTLRRTADARNATVAPVVGWDPARMLDADTVHPNDSGHALLASVVLAVLASSPIARTRPVHD